ncbi:MAG: PQQ-binding-like beta-propeller repeat protein [Verrucomicrobiota bacterium]
MKRSFVTVISVLSFAGSCWAADWLNFRGPAGSGVADPDETPIAKFDGADSIAWKLPLPGRGLSCPIIIDDKVFVTCSSGPLQKQLHIFCIAADSGEVVWERRFWATGRTMTHKKTNVAAPSPCSDGKHIFALFSSNDLICLDLDGNLKWLRGLTFDYPNASNSLGMASSPIAAGGALVVQSENDSESFAAGIDIETGKNLWKKSRPKKANWTSPVVLEGEQTVVALQSSAGLLGVLPKTGSEVFDYSEGASTIPSSAAAGGVVYVPSHGLTALQPDDKGGEPRQLWRNGQLGPGTGSPLVIGDKVYVVNNAGVLTCANTSDGERVWRVRTEGPYSGSPIAVGNFIYLFNEQGVGQIVDVTKGENEEGPVSTIDLEEMILCTPAYSNGGLFVRSDGHLWKISG